jgi:chromosomal replication initiation ATPase DnaA
VTGQLPLALLHTPSLGREDFVVGVSNRAALRLIESWPDWPTSVVVLTGPAGSGKSHLAHIWAARAKAKIVEAGGLADGFSPIGAKNSLVVEDVTGEVVPEAALFHLINSARETDGSVLLTSRDPPEKWPVSLPDLRSRLRLAAPVSLGAPEDDLLRQVLVKLFADRQLVVDKPLIDYLISRMERSLGAAAGLVQALDREALATGRPITRGMAAGVLAAGEFADRQ